MRARARFRSSRSRAALCSRTVQSVCAPITASGIVITQNVTRSFLWKVTAGRSRAARLGPAAGAAVVEAGHDHRAAPVETPFEAPCQRPRRLRVRHDAEDGRAPGGL